MIKLDKILHPTDFSENSGQALKYACAFADHFKAELHLLYVVADAVVAVSPPMSGFLPAGYYQEVMESAEKTLAKMPEKEWAKETKIVRKAVEGSAFVEIVRYAREHGIDMIVMGTHGHSALMHLIMGSVAENVVRKASCPVLTVHPDDQQFVMP